jgi:hypothetical protein
MASDERGGRRHDGWPQLRFAVIGALLAAPPKKGELQTAITALAAREWHHPHSRGAGTLRLPSRAYSSGWLPIHSASSASSRRKSGPRPFVAKPPRRAPAARFHSYRNNYPRGSEFVERINTQVIWRVPAYFARQRMCRHFRGVMEQHKPAAQGRGGDRTRPRRPSRNCRTFSSKPDCFWYLQRTVEDTATIGESSGGVSLSRYILQCQLLWFG